MAASGCMWEYVEELQVRDSMTRLSQRIWFDLASTGLLVLVGCRLNAHPPSRSELFSVPPDVGASPTCPERIGTTEILCSRWSGPSSVVRDTRRPPVEDVNAAVNELYTARLLDGRPLTWAQILNDCEDRAVVAAAWLLRRESSRGWAVGKVFVRGSLATAGDLIHWRYHVAPYVIAEGAGRNPEVLVIDPAFRPDEGIPLQDWIRLTLGRTPPDRVIVEFRSATAFHVTPNQLIDNMAIDEQQRTALHNLRVFRAAHPETDSVGTRRCLRVDSLSDEPTRAWFIDTHRNNERTNWYFANAQVAARLRAFKEERALISIEYQRVNLGILRGHFLSIARAYRVDDEATCSVEPASTHFAIGASAGFGYVGFSTASAFQREVLLDVGIDAMWLANRHLNLGVA